MRRITLANSEEEESGHVSDNDDRIHGQIVLRDSEQKKEVSVPENQEIEVGADDKPPASTGEESSGNRRMKFPSHSSVNDYTRRKGSQRLRKHP